MEKGGGDSRTEKEMVKKVKLDSAWRTEILRCALALNTATAEIAKKEVNKKQD